MVEVKFKRLYEHVSKPEKAHEDDVGYDIAAYGEYKIKPFETKLIKTGISVELPSGYEIQVRSRSGMALKQSLFVLNSPGTIDPNYRGEIGVILHNLKPYSQEIQDGDRVAQLVVKAVEQSEWNEIEELTTTDREENGFGSTGKQ